MTYLIALRYTNSVVFGLAAVVIATCSSSSSSQDIGFAAAQMALAFAVVLCVERVSTRRAVGATIALART